MITCRKHLSRGSNLRMTNNGIWILSAKASIIGPALVIPDMEDLSNASSTDFIAVMGRHKWGRYFHRYSKKLRHASETPG
jgi:hypothetical protein